MKNIVYILFFVGSILVSACTEKEEAQKEERDPQEESKAPEVSPAEEVAQVNAVANSKMRLSVKGMVCAMGCKGAIEKSLSKTAGVTAFEVGFNENQEVDETIVQFDDTVISADEIIASIEVLNDGAYQIVDAEVAAL